MDSGLATVGQTAAWVGFNFVKQTYETVTGDALNVPRIIAAAKKDGATAIIEWFDACERAEHALRPMLSEAIQQYTTFKDKCTSRKRQFSLSVESGQPPLLTIDGVGAPPHNAAKFAAAAVLYSWLPEEISKAISPPHSIKNAEEYYQFLHKQWVFPSPAALRSLTLVQVGEAVSVLDLHVG